MAIGSAIERGSQVFVYDERGHMLFSKPKGSASHDGLLGFTPSTVTVRTGSVAITYGPAGQMMCSKPV